MGDDASLSSFTRNLNAGSNMNSDKLKDSYTQIDLPLKTAATSTAPVALRDTGVEAGCVLNMDFALMTETRPVFDASIQCQPMHMDAGIDPGDWNSTVLRGVDSQTESPDFDDPLLWLSGSLEQVSAFLHKLLDWLAVEELKSKGSPDTADMLKLRADNILLKIEVSTLKRKLHTTDPVVNPVAQCRIDTFREVYGDALADLVGGGWRLSSHQVISDSGLVVTSSLSASSAPLGRLQKGDKIFFSGPPEEISGTLRAPVLPRGWVTLRDTYNSYLLKSA
jgi:hypothetical protein